MLILAVFIGLAYCQSLCASLQFKRLFTHTHTVQHMIESSLFNCMLARLCVATITALELRLRHRDIYKPELGVISNQQKAVVLF